jgi:predicted nucleic acid-binding protein
VSAAQVIDVEPKAAVIDASIGIKLFVIEEGSEKVDRLFNLLTTDPPFDFFVPDLFYVECANILWKYVRRFGYPAASAQQNIADLQLLALHSIPTSELLTDAFELALNLNLTAYDACYATLARRLKVPFVTADVILARKLVSAGLNILTVENL